MIRPLKSAVKWIRGIAVRRALTIRHGRALADIRDREAFEAYVKATQPPLFLRYRRLSDEKRTDFASALDSLGVDLEGKSFLDIGPAHGDSLDVAHERGAARIEFIEFEPFFFRHNELKPYAAGYQVDHRRRLKVLPPATYDLIWCKGGFSPEFFLRFGALVPLGRWLAEVERLARPGALILICPGWTNDGRRRNIEDVYQSPFTERMRESGYAIAEPIANHNHEPDYPVTYLKRIAV